MRSTIHNILLAVLFYRHRVKYFKFSIRHSIKMEKTETFFYSHTRQCSTSDTRCREGVSPPTISNSPAILLQFQPKMNSRSLMCLEVGFSKRHWIIKCYIIRGLIYEFIDECAARRWSPTRHGSLCLLLPSLCFWKP